MRKPKFTDKAKFRYPYADAKATSEPGYLRDRFAKIAESLKADEKERKEKVCRLRVKA